MTIVVNIADRATPELVDAMARLIPQLSSSNPPPTKDELAAIIASDSCDVLIARDGDAIVGSLTLVVFPIPTGIRAWIEDVVVDEAARGKGVGEALNTFALQRAREVLLWNLGDDARIDAAFDAVSAAINKATYTQRTTA